MDESLELQQLIQRKATLIFTDTAQNLVLVGSKGTEWPLNQKKH